MKIFNDITELIGSTPLIRLKKYSDTYGLKAELLVKAEFFNPAGSSKDRIAAEMIAKAEADGLLKPGAVIIEPTSGNTGIGLAAIAAAKGYKAIFVMPDNMSVERIKLLKAYGAEVVLTPGEGGMAASIETAEKLHGEIPGSIIAGQFENQANPEAHFKTTGPEIWDDTDGKVDIFVAGVGTGGTLTGVGRYLKSKNPGVKIIAVEPASSPLLSQGRAGPHGLMGIGANFIPGTLDTELYDEVIAVTEEEAYTAAREIASSEGVLVGISSGAALYAAQVIGTRPENEGKTIVALLPDSGERYLSTPLFE